MGTISNWYKLEQSLAAVTWTDTESYESINSFLAFLLKFLSRMFSLYVLPLSTKASWVPTSFLLRCSQHRRKTGNRSTRAPSCPAVQADEPADTQSTLAQTETLLSLMTVLDVMLPYGFAAMMGLSQALPAEHCRLWFKESIFHSVCSQWCSQQGQTAEPGLYTPTLAHLFSLSPGNSLSNNTMELTVLLQLTTKCFSLKTKSGL